LDLEEPKSYANCFEIIANENIISRESLQTFKLMSGYRNLIIHGYDTVEDSVTYGIYIKRLNDFRLFINAVRNYLSNHVKVPKNE
jgi:uncharacterized protein YutE (UPF0331/DUF86 family)